MLIIDELRKSDRPLRVLAVGVLAGLGVLLAGLWYVQVVSAKSYRTSQERQSFRTLRVPAIRGRILDANGIPLADNRPNYSLSLYLEELRPQFQSAYSTLTQGRRLSRDHREFVGRRARYLIVSNLFTQVGGLLQQPVHLTENQFTNHYQQRLFMPLPVLSDLNPQQVARYVEQSSELPGLDLDVQPGRYYPYPTLAAHLLGYVRRTDEQTEEEALLRILPTSVFRGDTGIEGVFDEQLRGRSGVKSVLVNSLGFRQAENVWNAAEPGQDIRLTIDAAIQKAAEDALRSAKVPAGGPTRGAVVVMDPRTGDLLALASGPSYDLNQWVRGMTPDEYERLKDPKLRPQLNRATAGGYQPGSVFKIIVGLAGLEAGTLHPRETYHSMGFYELAGRRPFGDTAGPGDFDFRRALIKSSNPYFIHEGLKAGPDPILEIAARCHFGERTRVPTMQDSPGVLPTREWWQRNRGSAWRDGDTANLSIGQGELLVSPLQVAVMISAVANGGKVYWPRLVASIEPSAGSGGTVPIRFPAGQLRDDLRVSRRSLDLVRSAMHDDVADAEGSGRAAAVPGMDICAKTGTATAVHRRTTWFASFAPYEQPRYVVVVMVEDGSFGGITCAPVAHDVYQALQKREQRVPKAAPLLVQNE
jgi:penicillin-binding protein 2